MDLLFVRARPMMKLRVVVGPNRAGSPLPTWASVEWVGRAGHPSSYGLLRGARSSKPRLAVGRGTARFREALASGTDEVIWGLPAEYETVVATVLGQQPTPVVVTGAAHGMIGSSPDVFAGLTRLLCRLLAGGLPSGEEEMWRVWDRRWADH